MNEKIGEDFDFDGLINAIKVLKSYPKHEFEDQKNLIPNLIDSISCGKLSPDSIHFKKICTQVRMVNNSDIEFIDKNSNPINYTFGDKEVVIGPTEYECYKEYQRNENVMRTIFGLYVKKEYPDVIRFENYMYSQFMNYQVMNYFGALMNNFK